MKIRWNLADLIDLEYLLDCDERTRKKGGDQALAKRDRVIYLARIAPKLDKDVKPPVRELLYRWLKVRRTKVLSGAEGEDQVLPGGVWNEVGTVLGWLALLAGLAFGLILAGAFLVYTGKAPLNVWIFLGIFVVLPGLWLALQGLLLLGRRLLGSRNAAGPGRRSVLTALGMKLVAACADWVYARIQRHASAEQRLNFASIFGRLRSRREQAGLFAWPAFFLMQLAAVGFHLGVIGLTLVKVFFFDMAFGWQSSLLTAERVAEGVRWIALPWSWFMGEGTGYPGPEQVQATMVKWVEWTREGAAHVSQQAAQNHDAAAWLSWWPFLCMAVLVYGLLPRLVVLFAGMRQARRQFDRVELRSPEIRRLLQRMTTPRVETLGREVNAERERIGRQAQIKAPPQGKPAIGPDRVLEPPRPALRRARPIPPRPAPVAKRPPEPAAPSEPVAPLTPAPEERRATAIAPSAPARPEVPAAPPSPEPETAPPPPSPEPAPLRAKAPEEEKQASPLSFAGEPLAESENEEARSDDTDTATVTATPVYPEVPAEPETPTEAPAPWADDLENPEEGEPEPEALADDDESAWAEEDDESPETERPTVFPGPATDDADDGAIADDEEVDEDALWARDGLSADAAAQAAEYAPRRIVLAPDEMLDHLDQAELLTQMRARFGPGEARILALPFSASGERQVLAQIREAHKAAEVDEIYLVQEAWMPPLQETFTLLAELRKATDGGTPFTLCLLGKSRPGQPLSPALPEHEEMWRKKLQTLADPSLDTRSLVEP